MAELIGELILGPIVEFLFHVGAYSIGRIIVPVISFGRWKCDELLHEVPKKKRRWHGLYHLRGPQVYLTSDATILVGGAFLLSVVGVVLWWCFWA